jgi:hypothetical protein
VTKTLITGSISGPTFTSTDLNIYTARALGMDDVLTEAVTVVQESSYQASLESMYGAVTAGLSKMLSNGRRQQHGYTRRHVGGWATPKSKYQPHGGAKQAAKAAKRAARGV